MMSEIHQTPPRTSYGPVITSFPPVNPPVPVQQPPRNRPDSIRQMMRIGNLLQESPEIPPPASRTRLTHSEPMGRQEAAAVLLTFTSREIIPERQQSDQLSSTRSQFGSQFQSQIHCSPLEVRSHSVPHILEEPRNKQAASPTGKKTSPTEQKKNQRSHIFYDPKALSTGDRADSYNGSAYRFTRNISFWLGGLTNRQEIKKELQGKGKSSEKATGNPLALNNNPQKIEPAPRCEWKLLERVAGDLLPLTNKALGFPEEVDELQEILGTPKSAQKEPSERDERFRDMATKSSQIEAAEGLDGREKAVCQYLSLAFDKYRMIRATLLIGFACIYEQNRRGTSMNVCTFHPSVKEKGSNRLFSCINAGRSQAQMMMAQTDANLSSNIFKVMRAWEWFPTKFLLEQENDSVKLTDEIERKFPLSFRSRFMDKYKDWEENKGGIPVELRYVIRDNEWRLYRESSESGCRSSDCSCHGEKARFERPLGEHLIGDPTRSKREKRQRTPSSKDGPSKGRLKSPTSPPSPDQGLRQGTVG